MHSNYNDLTSKMDFCFVRKEAFLMNFLFGIVFGGEKHGNKKMETCINLYLENQGKL